MVFLLNSTLYTLWRRALVSFRALNAMERLVVEKPAGVDDASEQNSGSQLGQLTSNAVQIDQHACPSGTTLTRHRTD